MTNINRVKSGRKSRRKGANNERDLAKVFQEWWGVGTFARTPSSGGWATKQARDEFRTCGDLVASDPAFPFVVEAKHQEGFDLYDIPLGNKSLVYDWWQQTLDETTEGMIPLLIMRKNRKKPIVMMKIKDIPVQGDFAGPRFVIPWVDGDLVIFSLEKFFAVPKSEWVKPV